MNPHALNIPTAARRGRAAAACLLLAALASVPSPAQGQESRPAAPTTQPASSYDRSRERDRERGRDRERDGERSRDEGRDREWGGERERSAAAAGSMDPKFAVMVQRSIFSRDRGRPGSGQPDRPTTTRAAPLTAEQNVVFAGVLRVGDAYAAFIENQTTRSTNVVHVGESLARGKVSEITLDSLTYEANGVTRRVEVGQNMAGEQPSAVATTATTSPAGDVASGAQPPAGGDVAPAAAPTPLPPGAASNTAEMMRQRRLREGGS